jgi:hypothetical protein
MAQSGPDEMVCCLSAFGAKRTYMGVWLRPPRSLMTHSRHRQANFAVTHNAALW